MAKLTGKMKTVADEIDAVLAKHGITRQNFRVTTDQLGGIKFSISAKEQVKDADGKVDPFSMEKKAFESYYSIMGFEKSWLGIEFMYGSKVFKLEGLDMKKNKNTVVLSSGGKKFIAPDEAVVRAIRAHLMMAKSA